MSGITNETVAGGHPDSGHNVRFRYTLSCDIPACPSRRIERRPWNHDISRLVEPTLTPTAGSMEKISPEERRPRLNP